MPAHSGGVSGRGFCVIDPGYQDLLRSGRLRIRNMEILELAFAWNEDGAEPRKTGYDVVLANANLDGNGNGPTWGTWNLYSDSNYDRPDVQRYLHRQVRNSAFLPCTLSGQGTGIYDGSEDARGHRPGTRPVQHVREDHRARR